LCNNIDENCDGIADNANDLPYDGIDQDCDGVDLLDVDGDGYCNAGYNIASKEEQCPLELSVIGSDCDDNNAAVHPETDEICGNNIDDNCNGPVDNEETPSEVEAGLIDDSIDNNCDGYIDELDINGGEVILGDTTGYHEDIHYQHYHGYIHVYNGGTLRFDAPSVSLETESLTVEADSSIDISGVTCGSGDGPDGTGTLWSTGGGGAGASHIGKGGNGGSLKGGEAILPYGSVNDFVTEPGSCGGIGGAESGAGGIGGGALTIIVKNDAVINGTITANGGNGGNSTIDGGGGGGGSGGGIFLQAMNFFLDPASTILSAIGGNGGNAGPGCAGCGNGGGGGGGGGGSIEIVYENTAQIGETQYSNENYSDFIKALLSSSDCIHVKGGTGGINGEPGEDGQPGAVNTSLPQ
jgi:hypothetical protein